MTTYIVRPAGNGWHITVEGDTRAIASYAKRSQALTTARLLAGWRGKVQIVSRKREVR